VGAAARRGATQPVRGVFPDHYRIAGTRRDGRVVVLDGRSSRRWALGPTELRVARAFDGVSSYADVIRRTGVAGASAEAVRALEGRLLAVGILADRAAPTQGRRWLSWIRAVDLATGGPDPVLNRLTWLVRAGTNRVAVLAAIGCVLAAGALVDWRRFATEVPSAISGWGLLGLLAAFTLSAVFHEGGHAFACKRFGVGIDEMGIGLRWLVPFAWTRPDQDAWAALPIPRRVLTITAGPLGSMVYAALGALTWQLAHGAAPLRLAGLYAVLAGTVGMTPTLIPFLEGDAYLLLEMVLRRRDLRRRSMDYVSAAFVPARRRIPACRGERALYLCFGTCAVVGTIAVTGGALWLLWYCVASAVA
jgi:putative peptide zinc metalloprotease protein